MSYWYIARSNELLLDLDDYMRPTKTGCPWGEAFFRRRLRDAMAAGKIQVRDVWLANSSSENHYHAVIRTKNKDFRSRGKLENLIWQLHFGSDLYRGRADLMRYARNFEFPSLLIRSTQFPEFYRAPDAVCECATKHDTEKQFALGDKACPIWRKYRGMSPWELFGPSRKENERFVPLPVGRVPLELIMKVESMP